MRRQMRDELLAQMEFNAQSMMSWDEKVDISTCAYSPNWSPVIVKLI